MVMWCFMVVVFLFLFPTVGGDAIMGLSLWFWWLGVVIMGGGDIDNGCRGCGGDWVASGWVGFIAGGLWWVVVVFFFGWLAMSGNRSGYGCGFAGLRRTMWVCWLDCFREERDRWEERKQYRGRIKKNI